MQLIKSIILISSVFFLFGCNQSDSKQEVFKKTNISTKPDNKPSNTDTLLVDDSCAVFIIADSVQINKRKQESGERFYEGAGDYMFYLNESQRFLDSVKLKTVRCEGKKYLQFTNHKNYTETINLKIRMSYGKSIFQAFG